MPKYKLFFTNESGATAIEYGLIASLISVIAIVAIGSIGTTLNSAFYSEIVIALSR